MFQGKRINARITLQRGFTLVELVLIIVMIGVLATVATRKMGSSIETARYEQTKNELDQLATAIAGNPDLKTKGARSDFGYVGDVGSLPPNLDALTANPGGYATWNGPYMLSDFESSGFKQDAWGINYTYADTLIRSTGSGSSIDKIFASSTAALLSNSIEGYVVDAASNAPGAAWVDSMEISLIYPDGTGGIAAPTVYPNANGNFSFTNVPIGNHTLRMIFLPDTDTVTYTVSVTPNSTVKLGVTFPADLW